MKYLIFAASVLLCACATFQPPADYSYREIATQHFTLAAWVKQTSSSAPFHLYIEGDGSAYTSQGKPSSNPTPKSTLMREMAFNDTAPNVAYIARPCQFVKDVRCRQTDWTTARFSARAVISLAQAVKQLVGNRPVEFYGYSGGALLSGLVIEKYPEIHVKKWITYAGLLNHKSWTEYHKLAPLTGSLDLDMLPSVLQMHYVGEKDRVIPPALSRQWTGGKNLVIVPNATHLGPFLQEK